MRNDTEFNFIVSNILFDLLNNVEPLEFHFFTQLQARSCHTK